QRLDALTAGLEEAAASPKRLANFWPVATRTVSGWQNAVLAAARRLHDAHAWAPDHAPSWGTLPPDLRVSFGLVRVANINTAIDLARFLARSWPEARIACYHANDLRLVRFLKESRLDTVL